MALANYADLLSAVPSWLHRTDLTSVIPDWVTLCETTINNGDGDQLDGVRVADQETTATLNCVAGTQTVALPSDFLELRRIYITVSGVRRELQGRPVSPIAITDAAQVRSIPETFFITGSNLYLVPIPDQAYVITIIYYTKVGPLATQSTNWLMTKSPMVYLFGTIAHGAPFLGPTFNAGPWLEGFRAAMQAINSSDMSRYANIKLRSEAAGMLGGGGYGYPNFLSGA